MKNFKKIVSLTLSVLMIMSMMATVTVFADVDPTVVIEPLYVDDFNTDKGYGYSINTNNSGGANDWYNNNGNKLFANNNTGHGATWNEDVWKSSGDEANGVPKPAHWYSYNVKTMQDAEGNGILYVRQQVVLSIGCSKLLTYVQNAAEAGADSYRVKFDVKPENLDGGQYGRFEWSYDSADRSAILFADGKVYYKMHKNGADPALADCVAVEGVSLTEDEFVTVEYIWENGNSIWKINDIEIVNELRYDSVVASVPSREIYFNATDDHALQIDNVEVTAYKYKPSPNSVWVEETFETYPENTGQGSDDGIKELNKGGIFALGTGGSTNYEGYSRLSSIMKEGDNQYLRMVASGSSGADATPFTKFIDYIAECGAESFVIDFDFRLENLPATVLEMRYKPARMVDGPYFMFYFQDDNVYAKAGNNVFSGYKTLNTKTQAKQWQKITFAYNDGVLRAYFDGELAAESDCFASVEEAAYTWLYFGSSAGNAAVSIDNLKFTCFSNGIDTLDYSFSESVENGGNATVNATFDSRLLHGLQTYVAVYDKETNDLVCVRKGVNAPGVFGAGNQTATVTVPGEGSYIVKGLVWDADNAPYVEFAPLTVN